MSTGSSAFVAIVMGRGTRLGLSAILLEVGGSLAGPEPAQGLNTPSFDRAPPSTSVATTVTNLRLALLFRKEALLDGTLTGKS